ncbi:MAG: (4Fe-4S)-binding protein [Latescibacteria bacterium DG_63]|nr:MAG: (4Fe-4S)-binding protein [Latescibacteria bacterium DG_63]
MKQLVVISGKGGTGKTVLTASFAALAESSVVADCDVDAADLHLLLQPTVIEKHIFAAGKCARIDQTLCDQCGECVDRCRFDAISEDFVVDPISCEGCAFCHFVCPTGAIEMQERTSGEWFVSETRFGPMVHAQLGIAEENSGKLVSVVRQKAKEMAEAGKHDWVIVDGAPGIGCPVIASLSGADCALVVTEPTLSGLHDADRVIGVARHFNVPVKLLVNKYDLNIEMTAEIEGYCEMNNVPFIGRIAFDESVVKAMVEGKTIVEFSDGRAKEEVVNVWRELRASI